MTSTRTLARAALKAAQHRWEREHRDTPTRVCRHELWLRPGLKITLMLPVDLTIAEAARLGRAILTFPFGDEP